MTNFPPWPGPEAVRRLKAILPKPVWSWQRDRNSPTVISFQQLMVDAGLPEPVDEAEALQASLACYGTIGQIAILREALAKARGERT